MKFFKATVQDIKEVVEFAENFEIDSMGIKIRKKNREVNEAIKILGFDETGIRNMKENEFKNFIS